MTIGSPAMAGSVAATAPPVAPISSVAMNREMNRPSASGSRPNSRAVAAGDDANHGWNQLALMGPRS